MRRGVLPGWREALLAVLETRGFEVGLARRASALETGDRELLRWLWRAGTASPLDEVFADTPE